MRAHPKSRTSPALYDEPICSITLPNAQLLSSEQSTLHMQQELCLVDLSCVHYSCSVNLSRVHQSCCVSLCRVVQVYFACCTREASLRSVLCSRGLGPKSLPDLKLDTDLYRLGRKNAENVVKKSFPTILDPNSGQNVTFRAGITSWSHALTVCACDRSTFPGGKPLSVLCVSCMGRSRCVKCTDMASFLTFTSLLFTPSSVAVS